MTPSTQPTEQPRDLSVEIKKISESLTKLHASGLNERGIVALVHDDTGVSKRTITDVLNSLRVLKSRYTYN